MTRRQIRRREDRRRRGAIFITAVAIMLILGSLTLVFCMNMRAEAFSAANRVAYLQADAIEQGVEQWVLDLCENNPGDAALITQQPANAVPIGSGYFWILTPSDQGDDYFAYGISDEAGKININKASEAQLELLPKPPARSTTGGSARRPRPAPTATPPIITNSSPNRMSRRMRRLNPSRNCSWSRRSPPICSGALIWITTATCPTTSGPSPTATAAWGFR